MDIEIPKELYDKTFDSLDKFTKAWTEWVKKNYVFGNIDYLLIAKIKGKKEEELFNILENAKEYDRKKIKESYDFLKVLIGDDKKGLKRLKKIKKNPDFIVRYDDLDKIKSLTKTGFFPWFRRSNKLTGDQISNAIVAVVSKCKGGGCRKGDQYIK